MKLNAALFIACVLVLICLQHAFAISSNKYGQDKPFFSQSATTINLVPVDQYYTSKSLEFVYELNFDSPIQYWYPFSISGSIFGSNSSISPPTTLSDISVQLRGYAGLESYTTDWQPVAQIASYHQSSASFESVVFPNGVMTGMSSPYVWTLLTLVNQTNVQFSDVSTGLWVTERLPWYVVVSIPLVPKTYAVTPVTLDLSFTQWLETSLTPVTSSLSTQAPTSTYFSGKQLSLYSIPYIEYSDPTIELKSKSSQSVVSSVEIFPESWQYRLKSDVNGTLCVMEKQECGYEYDYYSIDEAVLGYQRNQHHRHQSLSTHDIEERIRILPNGKFAIADDILTAKHHKASGNNIYNALSSIFTQRGPTQNHLNSTATSFASSATSLVEFSSQYYYDDDDDSYVCWKVTDDDFSFSSTYVTARGGFRAALTEPSHFSGTRWVDCSSLGFESVNIYVYSSADQLAANFTTLGLQPADDDDASSSFLLASSSSATATATTTSATVAPDIALTTPTPQASSSVIVSAASTAAWQRLSSQFSQNLAVEVYNNDGDVVAYSSHSNHTPFPIWAIVVLIVVPTVLGCLLLIGLLYLFIFCCTSRHPCFVCHYCCDDCCSCCDRDDHSYGTRQTPASPDKDVEMAYPAYNTPNTTFAPIPQDPGAATSPQPAPAPYSPYITTDTPASSQFAYDTTDYQPPPIENDKCEPSVPNYTAPEYATAPPME